MRESAGFSQEALGEALGVSQVTVGRYETQSRRPTLPTITAWAEACGYDLSMDFVRDDQAPPAVVRRLSRIAETMTQELGALEAMLAMIESRAGTNHDRETG